MMVMMIMYSNNKFNWKYWAQNSMGHLRFDLSRDQCVCFRLPPSSLFLVAEDVYLGRLKMAEATRHLIVGEYLAI